MTANKENNSNKLQQVYTQYGHNSRQFYQQIKKFLQYLIHRYSNNYSEDLLQELLIKIDRSMGHFDPKKGTLATFIFTACRNQITNTNLKKNNRVKRELQIDDFDAPDITATSLIDDYYKAKFSRLFYKLQFSNDFIQDFTAGNIEYEPVKKVMLWEKVVTVY
jgi:RNA polymerase sigma factor (sigma-70 family)